MKTFRASLALLLLAGVLVRAQDPVPVVTAPPAATTSVVRTPEQLEQLLAPIALYPDALLAIILPAATAPTDIVLAARQVREFPEDRSQIEHRAWDESVKSLTHYAEVLQWLDENLDWTKQVGEAFAAQPAEVMQAIQRLRAKARDAGTLVDTPQQQVIAEPDVIRIVPAQPDVIYVPYYQPEVVFVGRPSYYSPSFFSFGIGYPVGSWLAFDCDWRRNTIWVGNRHRPWTGHDWRRPLIAPVSAGSAYVRGPDVRQWRPAPAAPRRVITNYRPAYAEVPRPGPIGGAFGRPSGPQHNFSGATHRPQSQSIANPSSAFAPSYAPTARGQSPGLRSLPANTAPALASPPAVAPTVPSPNVAAPPNAAPKSSHGNRAPDSTPRSRGYRSSSPTPATPPAANTFTAPPASPSSNTVTSPRPSSRPSRATPAPPVANSYTAPTVPPPSTTVTPQRYSSRPTYTTPSPNNTYTAPRATPPSNAVSPQRPSSRPTPPAQSSPRGPTATPPAATTPDAAAPGPTTSTTTPPPPRSNNGNGRFRDRNNNGG